MSFDEEYRLQTSEQVVATVVGIGALLGTNYFLPNSTPDFAGTLFLFAAAIFVYRLRLRIMDPVDDVKKVFLELGFYYLVTMFTLYFVWEFLWELCQNGFDYILRTEFVWEMFQNNLGFYANMRHFLLPVLRIIISTILAWQTAQSMESFNLPFSHHDNREQLIFPDYDMIDRPKRRQNPVRRRGRSLNATRRGRRK